MQITTYIFLSVVGAGVALLWFGCGSALKARRDGPTREGEGPSISVVFACIVGGVLTLVGAIGAISVLL